VVLPRSDHHGRNRRDPAGHCRRPHSRTAERGAGAMTVDSWSMIEEAVFRIFDEIAGRHSAIAPQLSELGWSDIETEYPIEACELLFRAQGRSLAQTDSLDRVILAELAGALGDPVNAVVMPVIGTRCQP